MAGSHTLEVGAGVESGLGSTVCRSVDGVGLGSSWSAATRRTNDHVYTEESSSHGTEPSLLEKLQG